MPVGQTNRRAFIAAFGGAAAWPAVVWAQEPGRTYRLGGLTPSPRDAPHYAALFDELRRLGFIEGENLTIDWHGYELRIERFPDIAVELIKAKVDVIFCAGDVAIRAAQQATATIPILAVTDDMVGSGLVRSLAQPGGNTTGVSILATELDGKRQEILIEAVPGLRRMAALADSNTTRRGSSRRCRRRRAHAGSSFRSIGLPSPKRSCLQSMPRRLRRPRRSTCCRHRSSSPIAGSSSSAPRRCACPPMYQWPEMAEEGGLIAYGPRVIQIFRELGSRQLVKLFRGAKPADLPVEQPTHFELVINLKTAKAIGDEVPAGLVRAPTR